MKTSFSIAYGENGQLRMQVSGKLAGHSAREGLELLKTATERGRREIMLDLRRTTSVDSLGIAVFDWIREQNGDLNVSVILPMLGVNDDELDIIKGVASTILTEKNHITFRRERA